MPEPPYRDHLKSSEDLRTSHAAIRAGFIELALEKNRRATPFVEQGRALKAAALKAKAPRDLLNIAHIRLGLLTAAGVSDKAAGHLDEKDKDEAIEGLIAQFLEPAGDQFVEELVFRFLLIRGDTLGGSMRNVAGAMAQRKLTRSIIAYLRLAGIPYRWFHCESKLWLDQPENDADVELFAKGLSWVSESGPRTLCYNLTVPFIGNNIDLCLFNKEPDAVTKEALKDQGSYVALGELKGGIDPAGADEHWKTARTALNRIHGGFENHRPATFYIGAAIEAKMANEIWALLEKGIIDNAANLTKDDQISSVSRWLCAL